MTASATVTDILDELDDEIGRQDRIHPAGYQATRDGIRLGIAAAEDELREALGSWRAGRCKCPTPRCNHHDWSDCRGELLQTAAVIMRIVREIPKEAK